MEISDLAQTTAVAIGIAVFFLAALIPTLLELRPRHPRRRRNERVRALPTVSSARRRGGAGWAA